jgi:hypothetical protein
MRVGVDHRTIVERGGKPVLESGIYALCEVESEAFDGTGASSEFWAPGAERAPGWPTVNIRYLHAYVTNPLTIERLRTERPDISGLLINGFQAASFPITALSCASALRRFFLSLPNLRSFDAECKRPGKNTDPRSVGRPGEVPTIH